jgi:hypothetical protein
MTDSDSLPEQPNPADHQCKHITDGGQHARAQCENVATVGDYCGRHVEHPQRHIERTTVSLFDYVQDAMRALGTIVSDESEKAADRVRAANSILDRTGHVPGQAITLQGANAQLDEKLNAILAERATERDGDDDDDDTDAGTPRD